MNEYAFFLIFLAIPFGCLTIMYVALIFANKQTTGEIKFILPPDMLLKIFAVFLLIGAIFVLAVLRIITEATVAALLGAVASGTLGIMLQAKKHGE